VYNFGSLPDNGNHWYVCFQRWLMIFHVTAEAFFWTTFRFSAHRHSVRKSWMCMVARK
jgi:hypothetical protein